MKSKSILYSPKTILLITLVSAVVIGFCLLRTPGLPETGLAFRATVEPQYSRFLTKPGYTGAPFDSPIFVSTQYTRDSRGVARLDGLMIGLEEKDLDEIFSKLPKLSPIPGGTLILVEAKIHLKSSTGSVSTNPPSRRQYYKVVIDKLINTRWCMREELIELE